MRDVLHLYLAGDIFHKDDAIIPTGAAIQNVDEGLNAPLTLNVYTGANGSFEIYEDDGRSNFYEKVYCLRG